MTALRDYQEEAVKAVVSAVQDGHHPVASLPTGAGKSVVVAGIVERLSVRGDERIVVTVPSRELAEQNEKAIRRLIPDIDVGVVCAALGRREANARILVGTPQSLTGVIDFDPDHVIVDEAHQMPLHKGSWFARLFSGLPRGKDTSRVGLSATTFRTADGAIYGRKAWFTCQPYEIGVMDLVKRGFLASVRYVAPAAKMTTRGVTKSAGDYNQSQLVRANLDQVEPQVAIFLDALRGRKKGLIFAVTVDHAQAYVKALRKRGVRASLIVGAMSTSEREFSVRSFKDGVTRVAVTVQAALTGFDVPDIDLIASCRPTMSPIIHTQSIGRGTRPADDKVDCLVLDFAGNVKTFGPVHDPHFDKSGQPLGGIAPWRPCPSCETYNHLQSAACFSCGEVLKARRVVTSEELEFGSIQWGPEQAAVKALTEARGLRGLSVESIALHAYRKPNTDSVSCMVSIGLGGDAIIRVWHKHLNTRWWRDLWSMLLGDAPAPQTLKDAYARRDELIRPASIDIERDGNFWRIAGASYEDDVEEREAA
ncbi:DEAD/DEAH box helicase [Rhizobium sp. P32RR-XVIII]|uniref:DEAD/DEAH box helicase n=1 Tax=Rhizobium sp. P32RR-XVIII TaxID=2726738 RepID=UPI001456DB49|nr:DEAD/DEAH box helicase [Rhizobium sp. P32RR-XVIII]NLS07633.1 DEAD/DEAH box helicase [Rhizobium sp. P32RR-XVIII]